MSERTKYSAEFKEAGHSLWPNRAPIAEIPRNPGVNGNMLCRGVGQAAEPGKHSHKI